MQQVTLLVLWKKMSKERWRNKLEKALKDNKKIINFNAIFGHVFGHVIISLKWVQVIQRYTCSITLKYSVSLFRLNLISIESLLCLLSNISLSLSHILIDFNIKNSYFSS